MSIRNRSWEEREMDDRIDALEEEKRKREKRCRISQLERDLGIKHGADIPREEEDRKS